MQTAGYASTLEFIKDEMRRLDLLIRLCMRQEQPPSTLLDELKGLVLSPAEINKLLSENTLGANSENAPELDREQDSGLTDQLEALGDQIRQRRASSLEEKIYLPLPHLTDLFHLTPF